MIEIFVFGSNLAGRHGKGAARQAILFHGAIYGQGKGLQGNSYGIPTKDEYLNSLPLHEIQKYVDEFLSFADKNNNFTYYVTPIGCGLAGYTPAEIAPMFKDSPENVKLPPVFTDVLDDN